MTSHVQRLIRYSGTAGVAAIVDLGGFWALQALAWPLEVAAAASFLIATVVNYGLSARYVFRAPVNVRGYARFLSAALFGFVVNVGVTALLVRAFGLPPMVAKLAGIGLAFFVNFAVNTVFVFRSR